MKRRIVMCLILALVSFAASATAEPYTTAYGVKFGMTPQEIQDIETQNNNELNDTFEGSYSYQLYYETDIHLYSLRCTRMEYDFDLIDRLLFQVYYVSKGGAADLAYIKSMVTTQYGAPVTDANDTGDYSLLYDRTGRDDGHIDVAHWLIPDQNLGIDLWYNHHDTVFTTFYDTSNPASYGALPIYYTDETGISFSYMDGWDAIPFGFPPMMMCFTPRRDTQSAVEYMQIDLWENLKEKFEPMGFKREDIGADFLSVDMVSLLMQPIVPQNLRTKKTNLVSFQVFDHQNDNRGESPNLYYCTVALTVRDGYLHVFQISSVSKHDELMPAFEQLLSTVTFTK